MSQTTVSDPVPLDHYRNRIALAQAMGMHDYATDMAALLERVELAEAWSRVQAASRKAINDTWNRLRLQAELRDTADHKQHDSVMMAMGARIILVAANEAAEQAASL